MAGGDAGAVAAALVVVVVVPRRPGSLVRLLARVLLRGRRSTVSVVGTGHVLVPVLIHLYGFFLGGALVGFMMVVLVVLEELVATPPILVGIN